MIYLSLSKEIKNWLAIVDLPTNFKALMKLAIKVDNQLCNRERHLTMELKDWLRGRQCMSKTLTNGSSQPKSQPSKPGLGASVSQKEPMQLHQTRLSLEEWHRR